MKRFEPFFGKLCSIKRISLLLLFLSLISAESFLMFPRRKNRSRDRSEVETKQNISLSLSLCISPNRFTFYHQPIQSSPGLPTVFDIVSLEKNNPIINLRYSTLENELTVSANGLSRFCIVNAPSIAKAIIMAGRHGQKLLQFRPPVRTSGCEFVS